jgi:hypothetical protein
MGSADSHASTSMQIHINETEVQRTNNGATEDINRFLNDYEVRHELLNIRDNIDIREASYSYNKLKKKKGGTVFEPRVILLGRKGDKNVVPREGTPS